MLAVWASFISAAFGLLAGGAATYFTTRAQLRVEAEHAYDRSLRLPHYQRLFHLTRVMPRGWLPLLLLIVLRVVLASLGLVARRAGGIEHRGGLRWSRFPNG